MFTSKKAIMSKRASKILHYALLWTTNNVRKHNNYMKKYYELKRSQDKNHYNVLGHCVFKLLRWIDYILRNSDKNL